MTSPFITNPITPSFLYPYEYLKCLSLPKVINRLLSVRKITANASRKLIRDQVVKMDGNLSLPTISEVTKPNTFADSRNDLKCLTSAELLFKDISTFSSSAKLKRFSCFFENHLFQIVTKRGCMHVQLRGFKTKRHVTDSINKEVKPSSVIEPKIRSLKIFNLFPWRGSVKKLEVLVEKAESEESKELIKRAFTEGYLASGGLTKKFLLFIFILFLLPFFFQLYIQYGLWSDKLFSTIKEIAPEDILVDFSDVKGIDEAKDELMQVVDFLKEPNKYLELGGRLPKGVLLVGPPGIGKTLLARAIAGEAGVNFFNTSGSEFEEMFVGLGAKRVRDLFAAAREKAPCVVFIDEIDSVGTRRTDQSIVSYPNQTLNQLLSEMDGFQPSEGVIVLAATNRHEDLDPALLRPGRFDLELHLSLPDVRGRTDIFKLYLSKIKADANVDAELLARGTVGFSGADIENMVNQAALKSASDGQKSVTMEYLEMAKDLILMGPPRKNYIPDEKDNLVTAYHEAGHALVSYFTKHATPVHRITILPRGSSLGLTTFLPEKDQHVHSKMELLAMIDVSMGGRVAEELIWGADMVSSGCANDLEKATELALLMVKQFGMSDKVGFRVIKGSKNVIYDISEGPAVSTMEAVDAEVKRILQESYERAMKILKSHAATHKRLAECLIERETLDAADLEAVIKGEPLPKKQN
ncbi:ATP-dependent zinc metalloprotease YME1 -like protein [Trichinella pseudospiralis]|uniref:ATP-dependent zinc metalloprotease YME1-like protein n=1 Tax=Trichinella pseudospiralis TaxID=6337 RepID=A0A0V1FY41_TRIPS|nr:ATP-dependent zinc metalloprotease YME1 -like protein [Trichinella pseudospiralis]